jgi:nitronate monooxygenase
MENRGASLEELMPMISGRRGQNVYETGDIGSGAAISVGQVVGLIHSIPTVKEIIDDIITESKEIMKRLQTLGISD